MIKRVVAELMENNLLTKHGIGLGTNYTVK